MPNYAGVQVFGGLELNRGICTLWVVALCMQPEQPLNVFTFWLSWVWNHLLSCIRIAIHFKSILVVFSL